jgi:hypothetical protein
MVTPVPSEFTSVPPCVPTSAPMGWGTAAGDALVAGASGDSTLGAPLLPLHAAAAAAIIKNAAPRNERSRVLFMVEPLRVVGHERRPHGCARDARAAGRERSSSKIERNGHSRP